VNSGRPTLDWLVLEHENDGLPALPSDWMPPARRSQARTAILCGLCTVLTYLAIGGATLARTASEGLTTIEREVEAAVALQEWSSAAIAGPSAESDGIAPSLPHAQVTGVSFDGDLALAEVIETRVPADGQPTSFRRIHIFRFDGVEWVPAAADDSFLGAHLTLETERLVFRYRRYDRAVVEAAAPVIDAAYGDMRAALGLPERTPKLAVYLGASEVSATEPTLITTELRLPSPALWAWPLDLPAERLLEWRALPHLASNAWSEVAAGQPVPGEWHWMTAAVYQWLLLQHNDLLADWRTGLIAWRSEVFTDQNIGHPVNADEGISRLCAAHRVLERSVWLVGSSAILECYRPRPARAADLLCGGKLLELRQLRDSERDMPAGLKQACHVDPILATTVLDFAVTEYGPDAVGRLWHGFHAYRTWEELLPAAFGVSAEEFERGWQAYQMQLPDRLGAQ